VFTETWLTELTPALDGFRIIRANRTTESGKRKGGGLAVFVNVRWCNSVQEQTCTSDIEPLAESAEGILARYCDSCVCPSLS